jgi:hypothetical protein
MSLRDAIRRLALPGPAGKSADSPDTRCGRLLESAASVERELWLLVVGAMLVDVTLTVHGLTLGLAEQNPIARHALESFGVLGLYGLKATALGMGGCCRLLVRNRYAPVIPLGLAVPSLAAAVVNTAVIASVLV